MLSFNLTDTDNNLCILRMILISFRGYTFNYRNLPVFYPRDIQYALALSVVSKNQWVSISINSYELVFEVFPCSKRTVKCCFVMLLLSLYTCLYQRILPYITTHQRTKMVRFQRKHIQG